MERRALRLALPDPGATNRFREAFRGLRDRGNTGGAWVQELRAAVDEALLEEEGGFSKTGAVISPRALRRVRDHLRALPPWMSA